MRPTLILGLGNPLQGDDGVGCRVVEELFVVRDEAQFAESRPARAKTALRKERCVPDYERMPDDVEVMDGGTPGVGLLNFFEGRTRVIIIDAAEMGVAPGEYRRFTPQEVTLTGSRDRFSLHRSGVADALALARELKMQLPEIIFFGVQPASVEWNDQLSPQVQAALPRVIEAILNELRRIKSEG